MNKLLALGLLAAVVQGAAGTMARAVDPEEVQRAVDRGKEGLIRMQNVDGRWPHDQIGATALAGLALLECGVGADDKAIQRAADAIRRASVTETRTYSISLAILFFDRLGDPADIPLIESLMVRLLAGQSTDGGWTYDCPGISDEEQRRLEAKVDERKELRGRRELPKPGEVKRTVKDLPDEIRRQLDAIERGAPPAPVAQAVPGNPALELPRMGMPTDNSNTQFAALGLWVGRRYGLPVEKSVGRLGERFRRTQFPDGSWTYTVLPAPPGAPEAMIQMHMKMGRSAAMTCAGVMVLAIADGATLEYLKEHKPDGKVPDVNQDKHLKLALQALGEIIENPREMRNPGVLPEPPGGFPPNVPRPGGAGRPEQVGGRTYYFLWSLERAAVALGLDTIGKKDWYGWGAQIILANQGNDGMWHGAHDDCGADTAFALLFLKRANLARDLTAHLKGKVKDPGERTIRVGGVGGAALRGGKGGLKSGLESRDSRPLTKPLQSADPETTKLAATLVKAPPGRQAKLLQQMQNEKGAQYTEALALAIPQLEGEPRRLARDALADRLTRMKATVLADYLQDDDAEIRRAAALAVAMKESKELIPNLIPLLRDAESSVVRAAHAALKELTGQDFGPAVKATREQREQAALKWLQWWGKQQK